jgi:membrane-bound metal-dependent hydrolase YbcI (DUF457 family)
MTPVGHAAVGYLVGRPRGLVPIAAVVGALAPDIDFVMLWHPSFNAWHRVITHNLAFVGMVALALGVALARRPGFGFARTASSALLGGLSHLLIDACLDGNASNGLGIAPWWPFDAAMWSPWNLVEPRDGGPGWRDPWAALAGAWRTAVWELPAIAAAAIVWWRSRRSTTIAP